MDWLFGCFSFKCLAKSVVEVKEQKDLRNVGVNTCSSQGNKGNSSGHEIVLNTRIKDPEIKLCEASADKIVQDGEGRGDISNDSKGLNRHGCENQHSLRGLFHDFQKVSEGFPVEKEQDAAFCRSFLKGFDTGREYLVDSCLSDNANDEHQVDFIHDSQAQKNQTQCYSPEHSLTLESGFSSPQFLNQDTDMQKPFAKKLSISKSSGFQSLLNVSTEISPKTHQDVTIVRGTTCDSDADIEIDTQLIRLFPDVSNVNGETTEASLIKNNNDESAFLKDEEMISSSSLSSRLDTTLSLLSDPAHAQTKLEQTVNSLPRKIDCSEHSPTPKNASSCSLEFNTPKSLFQSISPPTSVHSEHSESSCFTESMSNEQTCSVSSASSSQVETPKSVQSSRSIEDRPILGTVAAHWNNLSSSSTQKWWDGKGIPNSTNKYKEDQKVSWHATPFEVRIEKALSKQKRAFQKSNKGK